MKAIIFDMNGTMIDDMMVHHHAWHRVLNKLGLAISLEEVHQKVHGVNLEILEKLFGDRFTLEERKQISKEKEESYRRIYKPDLKLIDGLTDFLNRLKEQQIPLAIGSAAPPGNVDFVLDNLNLRDYFDCVMHSDDVEYGKPHPEIYQKITTHLGFSPAECIVFEDTLAGAEAAQRAGCPIVVITTTHQASEFDKIDGIIKFISNYEGLEIKDFENF